MDAKREIEADSAAVAAEPVVAGAGETSTFRDLAPAWLKASQWLASVMGALLLPAIVVLAYAAGTYRGYGLALALAVLIPGWLLVVIVHECGHWGFARMRGMFVIQVVLGPVEIQPRRRGLRLRLRLERLRGVHGYVVALPKPGSDARRDLMGFALAGPLANLFAAMVCAGLAWWLRHSPAQVLWLLWGVLHVAVALLNIVPRVLSGAMISDGLNGLRVYLNRVEDLPGATLMLINGRLLSGESVGELPAELILRLEREPAPMPALRSWLDMYAALAARDLEAAQAAFETTLARIATYEEPVRRTLAGLEGIARADYLFARVVQLHGEQDLIALQALSWNDSDYWHVPHLMPRMQALVAALRGDTVRARLLLQRSKRLADNSQFATIVTSEAGLRADIERIIGEAATVDRSSDSTTTDAEP